MKFGSNNDTTRIRRSPVEAAEMPARGLREADPPLETAHNENFLRNSRRVAFTAKPSSEIQAE